MNIGLVQGIPLSLTTRNAWREAGVVILHRRYSEEEYATRISTANFDAIINAGSRRTFLDYVETRVVNPPSLVRSTGNPSRFLTHMAELAPVYRPGNQQTTDASEPMAVWLKGPGRRGANKLRLDVSGRIAGLPDGWAIQRHVEGQEYRVHTVGDLIVQGNLRFGTPTERDYEWCGVRGLPERVKQRVKEGVGRLAEGVRTDPSLLMLAWDVMFDGEEAFLLEANTAPGVNQATAERIVRQIGETA